MGSAIDRVVKKVGEPDIVRKLASHLTGPDLTTLLLAVAAERASQVGVTTVLARFRSDRFSRPAPLSFNRLREVEDLFISEVPETWDWVVAAPLVPFGTHAALGAISQDWVVTTVRANEAAADPTVALALEAARRRSDSRRRQTNEPERLATIQRIVRGQLYKSPKAFTHFSIFGLISAGRSQPREQFDARELKEHLAIYVAALSQMAESVEIVVSAADTRPGRDLLDSVRQQWHGRTDATVKEDRERLPRQRYYRRACFKVNAVIRGETLEIADGGFTDWTEQMLDDQHERLLISGAGLDRPVLAVSPRQSEKTGA
jgi:hypothetical protein